MAENLEQITRLRNQTGAGLLLVKNALKEANGNESEALVILRKKGVQMAEGRASRATDQGLVESYIHTGNRTGVLLEINCETDFVARNEEFRSFVRDLCMQVAAAKPLYVSREEIEASVIKLESNLAAQGLENKPAAIREKIVSGRLETFYSRVCLLDQPFIKDSTKKISELLGAFQLSTRENIKIRRFTRYELGV